MKLYLIRHAQPKSQEEDPRKPLSDFGRETMKRVAGYAAKLDLPISDIWHSDKLRARETAAILAESLGITDRMKECQGLAPNDNVVPVKDRLMEEMEEKDNIAIVGHLPFLAKLASLLLCGSERTDMIDFKAACIVCLSRGEDSTWALDWMIIPQII